MLPQRVVTPRAQRRYTMPVGIYQAQSDCTSAFQPGFPETLGFHQHNPGIPPEVIKMLRTTVLFNSPVQMCE